MSRVPDIEVAIHPRDNFGYPIIVRYLPGTTEEIYDCRARIPAARFALPKSLDDKRAYGSDLGNILFSAVSAEPVYGLCPKASDTPLRDIYMIARTDAVNLKTPLRFRLLIGAPDLYNICWETLQAPGSESPLATDEHVMFSRFIASSWWRHVKIRSKGTLRALVLIANPKNPSPQEAYSPICVESQLACAKRCLASDFEITELLNQEATAENLIDHLREEFDLLYIVCHGCVDEHDTWLRLDDGKGGREWLAGRKLSDEISNMVQTPPRLAVLAPCHSAGTGTWGDAVRTLGPQLAQAGIPAVVGMQGNVAQESVAKFFSALFDALRETGEIDRAVTMARRMVSEDDWWMPVLYMRLRSGRIWYDPGFDKRPGYVQWDTIVDRVKAGRCTPILGPDLSEKLFGSRRDIASRWARTFHYPLEAYRHEDLAQVAQFLCARDDRNRIVEQLFSHFRTRLSRLLRTFEKDLSDEARQGLITSELRQRLSSGARGTVQQEADAVDELIRAVGKLYRGKNPQDPHRLLAQLDFPVYVTTQPTSLLEDALLEADKEPYREICRWNNRIQSASVTEKDPDYIPTPKRPLVYHLFGHLEDVNSFVLTEDDYFEFLIGRTEAELSMKSEKGSVLHMINAALNNGSILYIGFDVDGRDFRVASRVLKRTERGQSFKGVAVQIDPEEDRILEPEGARWYLERHLSASEDANIYWGAPQHFLERLFNDVRKEAKNVYAYGSHSVT